MSKYDVLIQHKVETDGWKNGEFASRLCEHFGLGQVEQTLLENALSTIPTSQRTFSEIYRRLNEAKAKHFDCSIEDLGEWYRTQEGYLRLVCRISDHFLSKEPTELAIHFAEQLP